MTLRADLLVAGIWETTLQSLLDKERKVNEKRLAQLETIADDSVLSARVELMQEFKDEKSGERDPDYWIRLKQSQDAEVVKEEPVASVDRYRVMQSQEGDAPPTVLANATTVVTNQPVVMEQGAEQGTG